jgi:hypothetical protein
LTDQPPHLDPQPESESVAAPSEAIPPAPTGNSRRRSLVVAAGIGAVVLVGGALAGIAFAFGQPTALERVSDACQGSAPLKELAAEEPTGSGEKDADGMTADEMEDAFGEYFEGVVSIEDEGRSLIVATKSSDDDPVGISSMALECVEEELSMPRWLRESISTTRALDGRQSGEWESFTAQWGYHPDNGLNLIIVQD